MNKKLLFVLFVLLGIFAIRGVSHAATKTWKPTSGNNWNTAGNWTPNGIPAASDTVIFSASSTANCTISNSISVTNLTIVSGYTGTITQNSGSPVNVYSNYSQAAGTFTGSGAGDAISILGNFSLTGGTFTSTNGSLIIEGTSTAFTSGFQNNSGTVIFGAEEPLNMSITGSSTFYAVQFGYGNYWGILANNYFTIPTSTTLTIQSSTLIQGDYAVDIFGGGGTIDAQGDLLLGGREQEQIDSTTEPTTTINFVLDGSGNQTINDEGNGDLTNEETLDLPPNFFITKTSGTVNLVGDIGIGGNFTNTNATTINPGTSTVLIFGVEPTTITGTSTFNNLLLGDGLGYPTAAVTSTITIATGTTITALGEFDPANTRSTTVNLVGGGAMDVQGNFETGIDEFYSSSTITVVLDGTSTQTIGDQSVCSLLADYGMSECVYTLLSPGITITKTSGSVNLQNIIYPQSTFTNTNATTINPGTSTVIFGGGDPSIVGFNDITESTPTSTLTFALNGTSTFYNLEIGNYFYADGSVILNIATGTTLTTTGYFESTNNSAPGTFNQLNGGTIDIQGDILGSEAAFTPTGTTAIVVNGTGTQVIGNGTLNSGNFAELPNLTINKTSGVAYAENTINVPGSTTVSQGDFELATGTISSVLNANGTLTINSGARLGDFPTASTSTINLGSSMVNNGMVFFSGDGQGCTLPLPNDVILDSTSTGHQIPWSGSGNAIMRYVNVEDQGGTEAVSVYNGTNNGDNGGNWTFSTAPRTQLVQGVSMNSAAGLSSAVLPTFSAWPEAGDTIIVAVSAQGQTISAPTDNASNTYTLVASTTMGSSPSYALSLYYAKNINATSSLVVTAHSGGGFGSLISASAFEYAGMAPSTTFDNYSSNVLAPSSTSTSVTSLSATGQSLTELYFGTATISASTTLAAESGWTPELGVTNNTTRQSLYTEDMGTSSITTAAAMWTAVTGTSYMAIMGIFRSPYQQGYAASGTIDSTTFDTGVPSGAQLNSISWTGAPSGGSWASWGGQAPVGFQIAVSNSSAGPWNFEGPSGGASTYFDGSSNSSISLRSNSGAYNLFTGYRYFRYRTILFSDPTYTYSPIVSQVIVNWSP